MLSRNQEELKKACPQATCITRSHPDCSLCTRILWALRPLLSSAVSCSFNATPTKPTSGMKIKDRARKKTKSRLTDYRSSSLNGTPSSPPALTHSHPFSRIAQHARRTTTPTPAVHTPETASDIAVLPEDTSNGMWATTDEGTRFVSMTEMHCMRNGIPYDPDASFFAMRPSPPTQPVIPRPMPRNGGPFAQSHRWDQHHLSDQELRDLHASRSYSTRTSSARAACHGAKYTGDLSSTPQLKILRRFAASQSKCSGTSDCRCNGCVARRIDTAWQVRQVTQDLSRISVASSAQ